MVHKCNPIRTADAAVKRTCRGAIGITRFLTFFFFAVFARIGEAQHPGPCTPFVIGTCNSTGMLNKSHLYQQFPRGVYGMTETHITVPGLHKLRQQLHHADVGVTFIPGAPVEPVSTGRGVIGGKASGVGLMSHFPLRAMPHGWPTETWLTSRVQVGAAFLTSDTPR